MVLMCPDSFYVLRPLPSSRFKFVLAYVVCGRHDKEAVQAALVSGVAVDEAGCLQYSRRSQLLHEAG